MFTHYNLIFNFNEKCSHQNRQNESEILVIQPRKIMLIVFELVLPNYYDYTQIVY